MHHYSRHIGDYYKKAGRLSMLEHGAYTMLMDQCYDRERFPTEEEALDWCWARTEEEEAAVKFILRKFFHQVDGVYVQQRIDDEIQAFLERSETNKRIALEREARRREAREKARGRRKPEGGQGKSEEVQQEHDSSEEDHETCSPEHESCTGGHDESTNRHLPITHYPLPTTPSPPDGVEQKGVVPAKSESKFNFTDDDMTLAGWIWKHVQDVAPKSKQPNLESWANTIRLMRERDHLSHHEIAQTFRWANRDEFWRVNILSPAKLREKYATLDAKIRSTSHETPQPSGPGPGSRATPADRIRAARAKAKAGGRG